MNQATTTVRIAPATTSYYRHTLPVRVMHWINVVCFLLLLMSGLQIFNAHPALDWGKSSYTGRPSVLTIEARRGGDGTPIGVTTVFGHAFDTTGVLGVSRDAQGSVVERAFPSWATVPGAQWLAMARSWHFFVAWIFVINGLCYLGYGWASRHFGRDVVPDRRDLRSVGRSLKDHLLFRHPKGDAAKRYNVLQKLVYLGVIFVLLPGIVLMGWAMSPWLDALLPGWVDGVGGRQSARTLHFVAAFLLLAFACVHVFEVVVTGLWNNLRSMITGRYEIPPEEKRDE